MKCSNSSSRPSSYLLLVQPSANFHSLTALTHENVALFHISLAFLEPALIGLCCCWSHCAYQMVGTSQSPTGSLSEYWWALGSPGGRCFFFYSITHADQRHWRRANTTRALHCFNYPLWIETPRRAPALPWMSCSHGERREASQQEAFPVEQHLQIHQLF